MNKDKRKRFLARWIAMGMKKAAKAERLGIDVDRVDLEMIDMEIFLMESLREREPVHE